ncbi:MAG: hypothetical protein J6O73_08695 [Lachnospiraceae bacterium]|nr:hypothetical protein [Lachnospiraceae bacterium]
MRSRTRINHGQRSSLIIEREKESGKWEFQPEQIPKTITWDRENGMTYSEKDGWQPYYGSYNVILIRDKKGWARIYGDTEAFIIEIGLRKRKGFQTFHMIAAVNTDTVIPVTDENDEKVLILTNTFSERFAVRKKWMVSESQTRDFLCRLYESQDPEEAMKGFVFEDTSGLVRRLLKKKCYIVPDEYMLDFEAVTEDQEWKEKAESRLADALTEMQAEAER